MSTALAARAACRFRLPHIGPNMPAESRTDRADGSWTRPCRTAADRWTAPCRTASARADTRPRLEVDLIGARARTRLGDGVHGVIPARPLLEMLPVGRPAEVGGINVGGQPLLESVQLIRAAKMHLAAQHRLVSGTPQIVCEGRYLRGKFRGIVIGADGGYLSARQS